MNAGRRRGLCARRPRGPEFARGSAMELVLWRHAEAEEGRDDLARELTAGGRRQAAKMAAWLDRRVAPDARLLVSPAIRARQTAAPLARRSLTSAAIAPGAPARALLDAAGWPEGEGTVVLVGHQPALGAAVALALTGEPAPWRMKKGAVWWLSSGTTNTARQAVVLAALTPELL